MNSDITTTKLALNKLSFRFKWIKDLLNTKKNRYNGIRFLSFKLFCALIAYFSYFSTMAQSSYYYTLDWGSPNEHTYYISLKANKEPGAVTNFKIPAWRPGRYMLQNYAASISHVVAFDEAGNPLPYQKTDKDTWSVQNPKKGDFITIQYRYYANTIDAGSSYVGSFQAYFNGSNIFMYVENRYEVPCSLEIKRLPEDWKIASALTKTDKRNILLASDYHDFIDAPTVLSPTLKQVKFQVQQTTFWVHFQGKHGLKDSDNEIITRDFTRIIQEQAAIFGGLPLKEYHFIYQLLPWRIRHAVEHKYCAMFAVPEESAASGAALRDIYGITSHEFWHLWNVKRIRPAAMWPYQYQQEAYTTLHWFTEGVTEYYTELALLRSGFYTLDQYLEAVCGDINWLENSPSQDVVSPAMSSFDTWLAASAFGNPQYKTSFYTLGHRVGLLLDLSIQAQTAGKKGLDDVFKTLYQDYYEKNLGVPEDGVQKVCEKITGTSYAAFFANYVHGTLKIDYDKFLLPFGLKMKAESDTEAGAKRLGLERVEVSPRGWLVNTVKLGSDAFIAGLADKDIIIDIEGQNLSTLQPDIFINKLKVGDEISVKVFSENQVKSFVIKFTGKSLPKQYQIVRIDNPNKEQTNLLNAWISSKSKTNR